MKVAQKYSHLNGEEYLIVHHQKEYDEIINAIKSVDASRHKTKVSEEKTRKGKLIYNPITLNNAFKVQFKASGWRARTRRFYISTDPNIVRQLEPLNYNDQKELLERIHHPRYHSYNQTDFVKNKIAIEVQLGKYFAVTYDLFVKHLSFYTGQIINVGVEIVPTKNMQKEMSSGPTSITAIDEEHRRMRKFIYKLFSALMYSNF